MWHSWEESSTQNNRKRLQASERNKDQVTSLALDTVYTKKTKTFFLQGSVVQVTGGSSLAIADNLGKNLAGPKTGKCHFGPVGPIAAPEDLVGPPTFPLKSKLFLPQRLHSPCLQHWVLYAETTRPPPSSGLPSSFHRHSNTLPTTYRRLRRETLLTTRYKTETIDPSCNQSSSNLRKSRSKTYTATKNTASAVRQAKRRGNPLAELEKEHRDTGAGHLGDHDPATHESLSLTRVASQTAFFELSRHLRRGGGRIEGETQKGGPAERLRRRSDSSLERPLNNNKHIVISRRTAPVGRAV